MGVQDVWIIEGHVDEEINEKAGIVPQVLKVVAVMVQNGITILGPPLKG
jgi:hypothetical protein